jgi:hypothetical protein
MQLDESGDAGGNSMMVEVEDDPSETLMYVTAQTKEIARVEKDVYAPILRQWHPCPAAIAAITLHACFDTYFKRYVSKMAGCLSSESMRALQMVSELDKYLVQMAHDADNGDGYGGKQLIPYDVDSIVVGLVTEWMDDRLRIGAECVRRARDSEAWNPGSKNEPYAQSAVDLMKLAKATVDELIEIHQRWPMSEPLQHLADGIDRLVHQYASFLATSCGAGTKEGYIPPLPPLTRCSQDKRLLHQLLLNLNCGVGGGNCEAAAAAVTTPARAMTRVRPTTSGATQRLYVRLNTLHYMLGVLHSIDRSLALLVQPEAAPSLSLFDLCSHTNKDRRWETTTGVESRDTGVLPAGARSAAVGARTPESFSLFNWLVTVYIDAQEVLIHRTCSTTRTHTPQHAHDLPAQSAHHAHVLVTQSPSNVSHRCSSARAGLLQLR